MSAKWKVQFVGLVCSVIALIAMLAYIMFVGFSSNAEFIMNNILH